MSEPLPRIVIHRLPAAPDSLALLARASPRVEARRAAGAWLSVLVEEGRRFAATRRGRRWQSALLSTELPAQGWMLWNILDLDALTASPLGEADSLEALAEDLFRTVAAARPRHAPEAVDAQDGALA